GSAYAFLILLGKPLNGNRAQAVPGQKQRECAARQPCLMKLVSVPGGTDLVNGDNRHQRNRSVTSAGPLPSKLMPIGERPTGELLRSTSSIKRACCRSERIRRSSVHPIEIE